MRISKRIISYSMLNNKYFKFEKIIIINIHTIFNIKNEFL